MLALAAGGVAAHVTSSSAGTLSIAVQGNHFVNGSGQTIRLLGVDRAGSEYMCTGGGGQTFDGPVDNTAIANIAAWHTNAVRVPLNEDCWLGINGLPNGQSAASYQAAVVDFVNRLHAQGQYVILDLHWNNGGAVQATGQEGMADSDHAPAFWTSVATAFKSDPAVIFDLYNEPHNVTWDCWKNGGCTDPVGGFTVAGMQTLLNAVRATGATQPVMVGGLGYSGDLSQWLSFEPTDPANALVASFHTYNFSGCDSTCWAATVQPVAAKVPVVTGELGENDCAHGYIDAYMTWADTHGVSYMGWAWNPYNCGGFPSLISDYTGTPTAFGLGLKNHLAALASGPSPLTVGASASQTTGLVPLTVGFTGSVSGGTPPYVFAWNFGDSTGASIQSPAHTYTSVGTFVASLSVTDAGGAVASSPAITITVTTPPPLTATAGASPTSGQLPLAVAFNGSASGGIAPYTYSWNFGDGSAASTSQNPSHTYSVAGSYTAQLTVNDSAAHTVTVGAPAVTVIAPAPLSVTAAAVPTAGDAPVVVAFTATGTGGTAPLSYAWTFGDGTSGSGATPSHTYNAAGTYTASVTVTDGAARTAGASVTVTVSPALSAVATAGPLSVDVGDAVSFSGTPSGGLAPYSYSWNFGDGASSSAQNPSHAYGAAGMYTASLSVSDGNGVKASSSVLVTVHALPTVSAAASPSAGDAPVTVGLSASPSGGITPYSYSWNFGDGSGAGTSQNPSHVYSAAGSYSASVTVTDAAGHTAGATVTVTVSPALSASASASPSSGTAPLTVGLSASPSGGRTPYSYSWSFGDGSAAGTSQNPSHVYANAGTYTATVTVTDANGAKVTAAAPAVTVNPAPLTASITASPSTGDAPLATTLSAHAAGGTAPLTYAWNLGDGSTSTQQSPGHTYAAGSYTITLVITDSAQQTAQATIQITVHPALSVSTSATPTAGTSPLTVAFAATVNGGLAPYTYAWAFGDGAAGSGSAASHTYAAGSYSVALTVRDAAGGSWGAAVATVDVTAPPAPAGGSSGGSGNGTGTAPVATPTSGSPTSPSAAPSPSAQPSSASPVSPTAAAAAPPPGSDPGLNPAMLTVLASLLMTGIGGFVFVAWRRRRGV